MGYVKTVIVVAAIAVAISEPIAASISAYHAGQVTQTCTKLFREMRAEPDLKNDGKKAFDFAKDWLKSNTGRFDNARSLIKAWEAVSIDEDCSPSSWDYAVLLSSCMRYETQNALEGQLKSYVSKCLTSEHVSQKVMSEAKGELEFINAHLVELYHEDNPNERALHVREIDDRITLNKPEGNCCKPLRSIRALVQAIEDDLAKEGKAAAKQEFNANDEKVKKYLTKKLFKPCDSYRSRLVPFANEIISVSKFYQGGEDSLIGSFDKSAQRAIFRYKYCVQLQYLTDDVAFWTAEKIFRE